MSSNRTFGYFFSLILFITAGYMFFYSHLIWGSFFIFSATILFIISIIVPNILTPIKTSWFELGYLLGRFINPIVLGMIFFVVITPAALISRILGRDPLRLKRRSVASYWVDREEPQEHSTNSFKNQFWDFLWNF